MRRLVIRPILVALCWAVLMPACTWGVPGQDVDSVRGAKGAIRSQDELVSHVQEGKVLVVDGYSIQGSDLIAFMQEHPDVAIQVTHAIIEGGLDFRTIRSLSLEEIVQRTTWSQEKIEAWMARQREAGRHALPVITSNTQITDTDIRAPQSQSQGPSSVAMNADAAFFSGKALFDGATFNGEADFRKATFNGRADFWAARFEALASFQEARFFDGLIGSVLDLDFH